MIRVWTFCSACFMLHVLSCIIWDASCVPHVLYCRHFTAHFELGICWCALSARHLFHFVLYIHCFQLNEYNCLLHILGCLFWPFFTRPGPLARPSHGIDVYVCVLVCLSVCLSPPEAWTFRYLLDTLDL